MVLTYAFDCRFCFLSLVECQSNGIIPSYATRQKKRWRSKESSLKLSQTVFTRLIVGLQSIRANLLRIKIHSFSEVRIMYRCQF